jgi:hypothetical protein
MPRKIGRRRCPVLVQAVKRTSQISHGFTQIAVLASWGASEGRSRPE